MWKVSGAMTVTAFQDLPVRDLSWNRRQLRQVAGDPANPNWTRFRRAHVWHNPTRGEEFDGYKLPIGRFDANGRLIAVRTQIFAAMAAVLGARGGVVLPKGEHRRAYNHLAKYYAGMDIEPPPFREPSSQNVKPASQLAARPENWEVLGEADPTHGLNAEVEVAQGAGVSVDTVLDALEEMFAPLSSKTAAVVLPFEPEAEPIVAFDLQGGSMGLLQAVESPDEPPTEFKILNRGTTRVRKGGKTFNLLLDAEAEMAMKEAHTAQGRKQLPMDYDHGMLGMIASFEASRAAGWFTPEFRADGLYAANIEWTQTAFDAIKAREFRFTSPAVMLEETEEVGVLRATELINVALTNLPATVDQKPLVAGAKPDKEEGRMALSKELLEKLGLTEDATDEQIEEAVKASFAAKDEKITEANKVAESAVEAAEAANTKASETEAQLSAALNAAGDDVTDVDGLKARLDKLNGQAAVVPEMTERLAALEADRAKQKWQAVFDAGNAAGKLPPSLHKWAATQSAEQLEQFLADAPVLMSGRTAPSTKKTAPTGDASAIVLSDAEKKVCALTGMSRKAFKEQRLKELNASVSDDDDEAPKSPWLAPLNSNEGGNPSPYFTNYRSGSRR